MLSGYAEQLVLAVTILGVVFVLSHIGMIVKNEVAEYCQQPDSWLVTGTLLSLCWLLLGCAIGQQAVLFTSLVALIIMILLDLQRLAYGNQPPVSRDTYERDLNEEDCDLADDNDYD